jgi:RNA ligase
MPTSKIDIDLFNEYVDKKLISRQEHPSGGLYVWNYTVVAQYSRQWDEVTLQARGLITDLEGNIVSRPFRKFFNYEEYEGDIPTEAITVHEKLDGSLGIMYPTADPLRPYRLATRGSFSSDQALKGTDMLLDYLSDHGTDWINPAYTYLFEIIYPQNRIVVDYGKSERLVLLAVINTETAEEINIEAIPYPDKAPRLYNTPSLDKMKDLLKKDNSEGFVIRFESGLRLKMKFEEYVRLHRILTNVSSKNIWEYLKTGQDMAEILEKVPDEFYQWVRSTKEALQAKHDDGDRNRCGTLRSGA